MIKEKKQLVQTDDKGENKVWIEQGFFFARSSKLVGWFYREVGCYLIVCFLPGCLPVDNATSAHFILHYLPGYSHKCTALGFTALENARSITLCLCSCNSHFYQSNLANSNTHSLYSVFGRQQVKIEVLLDATWINSIKPSCVQVAHQVLHSIYFL